ncbi:transcription elongation factor Elf1 like-domain-containing protein [Radiomyces spectabilis]|uniref:transcription elongation factor Elf1 like-domain-containing protein n=1 Tax=Radiomyces spectabilis TaxID=64574 RepID=UPI00221EDC6C|nr:transcription elongation factor Elf1 like-domain-containing protein [Radiomyces spectabilis]KAI8391696.1 transcription elongation factor Elf1 like-domain-containing protein [Radiomyces spectabilis]
MGKRKAKSKPLKKLKAKLDIHFNCLFCNHEKSIECRMDQSNKVGHLACKICDISWQCSITYLDEPVDVYSAWIDACEEVNDRKMQALLKARDKEYSADGRRASRDRGRPLSSRPVHLDDDEDDDEDDYY